MFILKHYFRVNVSLMEETCALFLLKIKKNKNKSTQPSAGIY
jgi:hypothetical protein